MADRTWNEALATGAGYVDYDPLQYLKHLRAQIGYRAGYCIYLTDVERKRLDAVIAFNDGGDNGPQKGGE